MLSQKQKQKVCANKKSHLSGKLGQTIMETQYLLFVQEALLDDCHYLMARSPEPKNFRI
jgi:hypothetical protein